MRQRNRATRDGRAIVPRQYNRMAHGLRAAALVIPGLESDDDWQRFEANLMRSLAPEGAIEVALAARVAESLWRLERVVRAERDAVIYVHELGETAHCFTPGDERWARRRSAALLPDPEERDQLIRYEAHLNRQLFQALHELEARQSHRRGDAAPLARLDVNTLPETLNLPGGET